MAGTSPKLRAAVEAYFADLCRIRASGGATPERSYYPSLNNLLNAIGDTLRPKVSCVTVIDGRREAGTLELDGSDSQSRLGLTRRTIIHGQ